MDTEGLKAKSSKKIPRTPKRRVHSEMDEINDMVSSRCSGLWECYYDVNTNGTYCDSFSHQEMPKIRNIRGYLLRRRKAPLKGWRKRYFVLEGGILVCGRSASNVEKDKLLLSIDMGTAVVSFRSEAWRIDIDGEHQVLHLKAKNSSHFTVWASCLQEQQQMRQAALVGGSAAEPVLHNQISSISSELEDWELKNDGLLMDVRSEMSIVQDSLNSLAVCVQANRIPTVPLSIKSTAQFDELHHPESTDNLTAIAVPIGTEIGKKKKSKKKIDKKAKESIQLDDPVLNEATAEEGFLITAKTVFAQLSEVVDKLQSLENGFRRAIENEKKSNQQLHATIANQRVLLQQSITQNTSLREKLLQISDLATGIPQPISTSNLLHVSSTPIKPERTSLDTSTYRSSSVRRIDSFASVRSTMSDHFYDALDEFRGQSSDSDDPGELSNQDESLGEEDEEEDEMFSSFRTVMSPYSSKMSTSLPSLHGTSLDLSKENKPDQNDDEERHTLSGDDVSNISHRTRLPAPNVDIGDLSLWSILRKNIGKDLSRISMPVALNEPLSALQRLCEELRYCELLHQAVSMDDCYDRMVCVAAFAVSAYEPYYHRAGRKPFNPILGETYECINREKDFKFVAEQVSHHPPIAACHCISSDFTFWQDARIKNKFWGKSMEVFPIGTVNVTIPRYSDHYCWQKVTSCIYNLLGNQRWVDHYGEMVITNGNKCTCKLIFVKASYWSTKKYQVHGDIYSSTGEKVRHMYGTWNEAMYCGDGTENTHCVWRAESMSPVAQQYYGFSQFAMQLNEMEPASLNLLPSTDSRFRPDQRLLEDGKLQDAESEKHRVEQIQRQARAERERTGASWNPLYFKQDQNDADGCWIFKGNYWEMRENPGFKVLDLPRLW